MIENGFNVKPIIKEDNTILSLKIGKKVGKKMVYITVFDSYMMLKGSLSSLGNNFDVPVKKGGYSTLPLLLPVFNPTLLFFLIVGSANTPLWRNKIFIIFYSPPDTTPPMVSSSVAS